MSARRRLALLALGLAIAVAGRGTAQQPSTAADSIALERRTREVASELRCPVCQGESIQESPAELAQEMKSVVRDQLAAGRTPDEVKAFFVARYGDWILLRPRAGGVNALLYWLPPLALVAGLVFVLVLARRWMRAGAPVPASSAPHDDA